MRPGAIRLACLALIAGGMAWPVAAQSLYKCKLPDGRTVYQDSKCSDEARQSALNPPASSQAAGPCPTHLIEKPEVDPRTGEITAAARKSQVALEMVVGIFKSYDTCASEVPGFKARFDPAYREWRTKFSGEIATFQSNAVARRMVECSREREAERSRLHGADIPGKTGYCMTYVGPALERLNKEGMPQ